MKTIDTQREVGDCLLEGGCLAHDYDKDCITLINKKGERLGLVPHYICMKFVSFKDLISIRELSRKTQKEVAITKYEGLKKYKEKKEHKQQIEQTKAELKWAIEYFNGKALEEGDNITITAEFLDSLEVLLENAKRK